MSHQHPQPRPKRILCPWDHVVSQSLRTSERSSATLRQHKDILRRLAHEASNEVTRRERKEKHSQLLHAITVSKTIAGYIENYWEAIGGWKMMNDKIDTTECLPQYNQIVEKFNGCVLSENVIYNIFSNNTNLDGMKNNGDGIVNNTNGSGSLNSNSFFGNNNVNNVNLNNNVNVNNSMLNNNNNNNVNNVNNLNNMMNINTMNNTTNSNISNNINMNNMNNSNTFNTINSLINTNNHKEDPSNVLKKIGGVTKYQISEVVNAINAVEKCKMMMKANEEISIVKMVKSAIIMYEETPQINEIFLNYNGERQPILIILKDDRTRTMINDLVSCFVKYSCVVALNDADEETIGRVARGNAEITIINHSILKRCLKQIHQRKFELVVYETEDNENEQNDNELTKEKSLLLTYLKYDSLILFAKTVKVCFPRFLTLLFPNDLPSTFWMRCSNDYLEQLSHILVSLILDVPTRPPTVSRQIEAPGPMKLVKQRQDTVEAFLEIPQYPKCMLVDLNESQNLYFNPILTTRKVVEVIENNETETNNENKIEEEKQQQNIVENIENNNNQNNIENINDLNNSNNENNINNSNILNDVNNEIPHIDKINDNSNDNNTNTINNEINSNNQQTENDKQNEIKEEQNKTIEEKKEVEIDYEYNKQRFIMDIEKDQLEKLQTISPLNSIRNELIVRRKMLHIDIPEQRRLPTPNLLDSMRRSNSLKPLLDTMDTFVRRGKRFAVVTNQIRFTSLILQALQVIKPTSVVILKRYEETSVLAGIHKMKGGCVIVSDECVESLKYFTVDSVVLLKSSIGDEIKSIVGTVDIVFVGKKSNMLIEKKEIKKSQRTIDVYAKNNYIPVEKITKISQEQLIENILEHLQKSSQTTEDQNEIKMEEEQVNVMNEISMISELNSTQLQFSRQNPPTFGMQQIELKNNLLPWMSIKSQPLSKQFELEAVEENDQWDDEIKKIEKNISNKIEHIRKETKNEMQNKLKQFKEKQFLKDGSDNYKMKEHTVEHLQQTEIPSLLFEYKQQPYNRCTKIEHKKIPRIKYSKEENYYINPTPIHLFFCEYNRKLTESVNKKTTKSTFTHKPETIQRQLPIHQSQQIGNQQVFQQNPLTQNPRQILTQPQPQILYQYTRPNQQPIRAANGVVDQLQQPQVIVQNSAQIPIQQQPIQFNHGNIQHIGPIQNVQNIPITGNGAQIQGMHQLTNIVPMNTMQNLQNVGNLQNIPTIGNMGNMGNMTGLGNIPIIPPNLSTLHLASNTQQMMPRMPQGNTNYIIQNAQNMIANPQAMNMLHVPHQQPMNQPRVVPGKAPMPNQIQNRLPNQMNGPIGQFGGKYPFPFNQTPHFVAQTQQHHPQQQVGQMGQVPQQMQQVQQQQNQVLGQNHPNIKKEK